MCLPLLSCITPIDFEPDTKLVNSINWASLNRVSILKIAANAVTRKRKPVHEIVSRE